LKVPGVKDFAKGSGSYNIKLSPLSKDRKLKVGIHAQNNTIFEGDIKLRP